MIEVVTVHSGSWPFSKSRMGRRVAHLTFELLLVEEVHRGIDVHCKEAPSEYERKRILEMVNLGRVEYVDGWDDRVALGFGAFWGLVGRREGRWNAEDADAKSKALRVQL